MMDIVKIMSLVSSHEKDIVSTTSLIGTKSIQ